MSEEKAVDRTLRDAYGSWQRASSPLSSISPAGAAHPFAPRPPFV